MGAGNDNEGWLDALTNTTEVMDRQSWQRTHFSAGSFGYDVDPETILVNGTRVQRDKVQMAVLIKFSGAAAPKEYYLAGPTRWLNRNPIVSTFCPFLVNTLQLLIKKIHEHGWEWVVY